MSETVGGNVMNSHPRGFELDEIQADVVVVGAGVAGICAAVAAASYHLGDVWLALRGGLRGAYLFLVKDSAPLPAIGFLKGGCEGKFGLFLGLLSV